MFGLYIFPGRRIRKENDTGLRYIQWYCVTLHNDPLFCTQSKWKVYPDAQ